MHGSIISFIRYILQFARSPHVIYLCTYLFQVLPFALEHDKLDQVYCDLPFTPHLLV